MKACKNILFLPLYIPPPLCVSAPLNITPFTMLFTVPSIISILQIRLKPRLFSELHLTPAPYSMKVKVKVKSLSRVRLFATPRTVTYQAPPSMAFSRQEYWSGVPLPSP